MPVTFLMLPPQTATTREWAKRLATAVPEISVVVAEDEEAAARVIGQAEGAFGTMPRALLAKAARLRWIQAPQAAPPAGWYYPELIAHPAVVTNFREIYNDHIGAHIMAFVLAFARGLHLYLPRQLERQWRPEPLDTGVVHLPEATALIVGVGGIGAEAARLAASFGMRVIGVDARRREAPPGMAELHGAPALDSLLPRADFVILTVPHTPATEGFMDRACFQRMKRTAFFINIGRGMTTRLDDLAAALEAGEIAGAGLDVFEQEPLRRDHPLWAMPGVLITPHTAGFGPYLADRRYDILADNSRRFLRGLPLRNVVDKASWF
jgi:phosphoglycerate dehydrogenase-like enzyme